MPAIGGILFFLCANSYALGPVDGEIGIAGANIDAGSTFFYGEGWIGQNMMMLR